MEFLAGHIFKQVFGNEQHFRIPDFQRPYSWEKKMWATLWIDIMNQYKVISDLKISSKTESAMHTELAKSPVHYLGAIVTTSGNAMIPPPSDVLDGQQRLITSSVIYLALRDSMLMKIGIGESTEEKFKQVKGSFTSAFSNSYGTGDTKFRILTQDVDRSAWEYLLSHTRPIGLVKRESFQQTAGNSSGIIQAFNYFFKEMNRDSLQDSKLRELYFSEDLYPLDFNILKDVITTRLSLVRIMCEANDDVNAIFESLNAKSEPLKQVDLIKNYIYISLQNEEASEVYKESWRPMEKLIGAEKIERFVWSVVVSQGHTTLANQAYLAFGALTDDARVRIKPSEIKKKGHVPKNGNVFFTIFQTFMSGEDGAPNFGEYPPDFFDFIIIDECHRGGANDESSWREIMNYFAPAVQLGLTATPKRNTNVDTYEYFGEPVYTYSLKDGINDGFLTPFRVKRITSDIDEYTHTPDDQVLEGEIEAGKVYTEGQINNEIYIPERELLRVKEFMSRIDQNEKTLVFCANQWHAGVIRDLINQVKDSRNPDYCVRVTANDGEIGEEWLRKFQDNDKMVPTILTTSHKLSTGVDALNVRNIVLLRPIKSMIEFKQIVGRGTRLFEGKDYFTIYDFVKAYEHFNDPEWDGDPEEPELPPENPQPPLLPVDPDPVDPDDEDKPRKDKAVINFRDGKLRAVSASLKSSTMFIGPTGNPITAEEFIGMLYDTLALPEYFANEDQLRDLWSDPLTRRVLLNRLAEAGFSEQDLEVIMKLIEAENSDLYDVLEFVAFAKAPISRVERVFASRAEMQAALSSNQRDFIDFVLDRYMSTGVEELDADKLPDLMKLKYNALQDGLEALGGPDQARAAFVGFQKYLYRAG